MATRILLIIPTLDRSGAEKQLTLLATGLPRDEFDVQVCALTRGGPLAEDLEAAEIPVTVIGKGWKIDPAAYWRLKRHIRRVAPDVVHTWLFAANCYGRAAAGAARSGHIIASERCVDRWKSWHQLAIDRWLARRTELIVANSTAVRDFYADRGIAREKLVVIPNGVPTFNSEDSTTREEVLSELNLPSDARLIGAIGRLWPQKRFKDLIWAADLLKTIRDDIHLLIIGDGPHRWRLERFRDQCHIRDRVHFLGFRDDVPRLLPHFDCLWLASSFEGQSNAVMEAMSAAVPVVATDIPGNRDLVLHESTGYLVPIGDRAEFAKRTNRLLDDPELARRMGESGRRRMLDEFSLEKMVAKHADLYREIMSR